MENLPGSSDKEFWLGDINQTQVVKKKAEKTHRLVKKGPYVVCVSCPYEHTVPLDPDSIEDNTIVRDEG